MLTYGRTDGRAIRWTDLPVPITWNADNAVLVVIFVVVPVFVVVAVEYFYTI